MCTTRVEGKVDVSFALKKSGQGFVFAGVFSCIADYCGFLTKLAEAAVYSSSGKI